MLDEANNKQLFFVDGVMVASNSLPAGAGVLHVVSPTNQFWIGTRTSTTTSTTPTNQFQGSIDEVAIYNYALSGSQVQNHYFASGIAPALTMAPTNTSADDGATATFYSLGYGTTNLNYQWYQSIDSGASFQSLAGQTGLILNLNNVQQSQSGYQYEVVVTNTYGTVTSPPVTLTVIAGPPTLVVDVQSSYTFSYGYPITVSAVPGGTAPFTYGWWVNGAPLSNNARVSGANSNTLTIASSLSSDSGNYQLFITNGLGSTNSGVAAVTVTPYLGFNGPGAGWNTKGGATYPANNEVKLTDGSINEARDSFFSAPVNIIAFEATWTYQDVNTGGADTGADGTAFVVQNDPRGAAAIGANGAAMGYTGITPSAAVEFNIYHGNSVGGIGAAFSTNGIIAHVTPTGSLDIASGDPINVTLIYANGHVSLMLTDAVAQTSFTMSTNINLPAVVGGSTAYIGFTGGAGGTTSTQTVSNFAFVNLFELTAQVSGNNIVVVWPTGNGAYQLQQKNVLGTGGWSSVAQPVTVVGGMNQMSIPISSTQYYYRLQLQ